MIKTKNRIFLIALGLLFFFLVLEVSLRLAGSIYYRIRMSSQKETAGYCKGTIKILCLGDSFTFGHGAEKDKSYPAQLQRLLDESRQDKKFIVYNAGVSGYSSSMVLKRLVKNLDKYKPNIVLLLIGSNDRTVLEDSNYYLFKRTASGVIADLCLKLDIFFSKFKSYKLIRTITLSLKNRFNPEFNLSDIKFEKDQNEYKARKKKNMSIASEKNTVNERKDAYLQNAESLYYERKFSDAEKAIKEAPGGYNPTSRRESLFLGNIYYEQEKYDLAISAMADYMKDNPKDAEALFTLGKIYYMQGKSNPSDKKESFERAVRMFKEALLYDNSADLWLEGDIYGYLSRLYFDRGENALAKEMMEKALKFQPNNRSFQQFIRVISELSLSEEENEIFGRLLYYNLGQVVNLCRIYEVQIMLLSYPCEGKNGIREKIANKYKVPFIDIGSRFSGAASKYKQKDLLSSDGNHPNANGYRIMAEAVLETLNSETGASL